MVQGQAKAETGMIQTVGRMVFVEFDSLHAHFNRPWNNQQQDVYTIHTRRETKIMATAELEVLQPYCENDMRLLKGISRSIFMRFNEPLTQADHDDFFSMANMTLWQAYNSYDPDMGISFDVFLRTCLQKKFKSELTRRYRKKRIINKLSVSLDATDESDEKHSLLDFIPSDFDTFEEAVSRQEHGQYRDKAHEYVSRLSNQQVNILNLLMDGYKPHEIRRILEISQREYADNLQIMRSYENIKILF